MIIQIPPKLIPVFEGSADIRGSYGGRGSGKTRSFALMAAVQGLRFGQAGVKGQILCARKFMNSLEDSSLEEIKRAIESDEILSAYYEVGDKYIKSHDGNIRFTFVGLDRNLSSVKSKGRILICWIDEAAPISEQAFTALVPTLREEGTDWNAELWLTWNPANKNDAVERLYRNTNDPRVKIFELNYTDNPRFPKILERERIRCAKERPEVYGHIWEGDYLEIVEGSIFKDQFRQLGDQMTNVPYMRGTDVHTFWDLGRNDHTAIWFMQNIGNQYRFIDYYENRLKDIAHYCEVLKEKGYYYGTHYMPHDIESQMLGVNITRKEQFKQGGLQDIHTVPRVSSKQESVEAARRVLPLCWFDVVNCERGLECLKNYKYKYDADKETYSNMPVHDWSSNGSDAFQQFAIGYIDKPDVMMQHNNNDFNFYSEWA